jgi:hypothetical protein
MSTLRELHWECIFTGSRLTRTLHVLAWDAADAVQAAREDLLGDGVTEAGTIAVRGPTGAPQCYAFQPAALAPLA